MNVPTALLGVLMVVAVVYVAFGVKELLAAYMWDRELREEAEEVRQ